MSDEEGKKAWTLLQRIQAVQPPRQPLTLLEAYNVQNRVYKNQQVKLDGYTFTNCAFISCELFTSKGNFHIRSCHFQMSTLYFSGNALNVVKLSSILMSNWEQLNESLKAHIAVDGGVTIG